MAFSLPLLSSLLKVPKFTLMGKILKALAYFTSNAWTILSYYFETLYNVLYQITVPILAIYFFNVNSYYLSAVRVSTIKNLTFVTIVYDFLTIIRDHAGWSLTRNRKQKSISNFLPEEWSRSLKKFE